MRCVDLFRDVLYVVVSVWVVLFVVFVACLA